MAIPTIRTATTADEAAATAVMTLAFGADPAARWTWPDPEQYLAHFPSFVKVLGGKAFAHGSAYCVDGVSYALNSAGVQLDDDMADFRFPPELR